jgi:hypothetical protein
MVQTPRPQPDPWRGQLLVGSRCFLRSSRISNRISKLGVEELRALWRERRGQAPPEALSKDLIARVLAHWVQEERLGRLASHMRKFLASISEKPTEPVRRVKVGSVIVREYQGKLHELMVVPDGFLWQGQIYTSLSTIALKITGTSWSGRRFFGLQAGADPGPASGAARAPSLTKKPPARSRLVRSGPSAVAGRRLPTPPLRPRSPTLAPRARSNIRWAGHEGERSKTPTLRDLHAQID